MEELRRELAHRPLVLVAAALVVGLTAVLHPLNLIFLIPLVVARRPVPVALAFVIGLALAPRPAPVLPSARWIDGWAAILSVPTRNDFGLAADVEVGEHRWRVSFPFETPVSRGELWAVKGVAKPLGEGAEALRLKGIEGRLTLRSFAKAADGPLVWRLADGWRRSYASFVRANLPADAARWLEAFAFRTGDLEDGERDALTRTGTVHLVAASGIHVGALGLVLVGLGTLLGLPRSATLAVVFLTLALYAMATGLHLPTVRAALAFAAGSAAYLARREPDGLSALALAVLVYLPFDPVAVYGLGFQLSTVVVLMLVLWPRREGHPEETAFAFFRRHTIELVAVSCIAALAAAPIVALHEGELALLSVPANVVAVPPVLAALVLSLVFHPLHLGALMPFVGGLVLFAKAAVGAFDAVPDIAVPVAPFWPYLLVPFYAAWIVFWRPRARPA